MREKLAVFSLKIMGFPEKLGFILRETLTSTADFTNNLYISFIHLHTGTAQSKSTEWINPKYQKKRTCVLLC